MVRLETRWVGDQETGARRGKEAPVRCRPWWWNDSSGQVVLDRRYGDRRVESKPGASSIDVGEADNLVPTIELLIEACRNGEMDEVPAKIKKAHHRILRKKTKR